jgi:hypothetical protein
LIRFPMDGTAGTYPVAVIGSVKVNLEPLPASLSTQIFPPCSSTNFLDLFTPFGIDRLVLPRFQIMRGKLSPPARGRLLAVVSQRSLDWNVRHAENDGRVVAAVHVLVKRPSRHGKNVLFLPVQSLAVDHRVA